ncbi:acyl-[acyl-carrier-protein] thioesterase [Lactobacillus acetotolerans]|nr:acyl-ACP thioesterase domain-containing protein [Lactobacillus acetotolerans]
MKYSEKHQVEFYECDENEHLKLPSLVDLMMQVSEHQLDKRGIGTNTVVKHGEGWVVTQYHFDIENLPKPGDEINLITEASGYNRFFEYRDFMFDDKDGNRLVTVRSEWVLFDLQKRKMLPTDEKLMANLEVPLLKKLPRFPRLRALKSYDHKRQYRVRYDDLDTNHHLTNSHYFNWFIDMLDRDFMKKFMVQAIDIKFNKEVRYSQMPYSCMTLKKEDNQYKSYHAIEDEKGKDQAVCELTWRKI